MKNDASFLGAKERVQKTPNLFLVGAMRSGTTTLHNLLNSHDDVFLAPIKEPNYFSKDLWDKVGWRGSLSETWLKKYLNKRVFKKTHSANVRSWGDYLQLFTMAETEMLIGESSPSYLRSTVAAKAIAKRFPGARVLMILRNPLQRAYSHYKMLLAQDEIDNSFEDTLINELEDILNGNETAYGLIEGGLYYEQVKRYLNCFTSPGQVKVMLFNELKLNDRSSCIELAGFLGVNPERFNQQELSYNNISRLPRSSRFNAFLQRTRLKTLIRNSFPTYLLNCGKRFFYTPSNAVQIDYNKLSEVISFINTDITNLSRLIDEDLSEWKLPT